MSYKAGHLENFKNFGYIWCSCFWEKDQNVKGLQMRNYDTRRKVMTVPYLALLHRKV